MSVNHSVNEFYDGSQMLSSFIPLTGLPIDQVGICIFLTSVSLSKFGALVKCGQTHSGEL